MRRRRTILRKFSNSQNPSPASVSSSHVCDCTGLGLHPLGKSESLFFMLFFLGGWGSLLDPLKRFARFKKCCVCGLAICCRRPLLSYFEGTWVITNDEQYYSSFVKNQVPSCTKRSSALEDLRKDGYKPPPQSSPSIMLRISPTWNKMFLMDIKVGRIWNIQVICLVLWPNVNHKGMKFQNGIWLEGTLV